MRIRVQNYNIFKPLSTHKQLKNGPRRAFETLKSVNRIVFALIFAVSLYMTAPVATEGYRRCGELSDVFISR